MSNSIDARPLTMESADRLDRLFRLYNKRLLGFAVTRTRDYAAAEDVVSETWLRAAVSLSQLQADDAHAYGWLRSIAFRAAVDQYRPRRASEQPRDWTDAVASFSLPATPPADGDALALADLSVSQCAAIKLAAQGLTHRAIASRMGRSRGAVYSHLHRGARKLRTAMERSQPLPMRPTPHERDGRQPTPQPARPHSRAFVALAG
ncbi:RNA polymerase sigma factor [Streptomyces sp. H10-C2]|uniref:RNA polymerase sigma factor n=1 Tax=unclassified Streptomyces TaxID=2593676 RepID=UPI0024BA0E99|nr:MULTISPECIES: RNA polymerase sigma factor [unclassified Streptomyces]MDJ0347286.1 RNA polymerase sigma factor [Streptomyces sp. PH10-H1]MDJ0375520.1 RNA polymerase sigma factor [Streptomyces sp. H10-C2]